MVLINQKNCGTSVKNLGVSDCILQNGRITGMFATAPSWSVDTATATFTQTEINDLVQSGTFIPIMGAVEVVNSTPEPTTEEYQGGVMSVVRNGLPMFVYKFLKGWAYARALYSMNSFQAYKVLLVFEDGSIAGVLDGTILRGYDLGMLNTNTYFHTDGNVSGFVNTTIQLTNANQYNLHTGVIDRTALGFDANTVFPITDVVLTARADVSDAKVYFKAKMAMNQANNLLGIAVANLKLVVNGIAGTITALSLTYNTVTEEWEFTPTTPLVVSDIVSVQLYDVVNSVDVAKIGQKYYKGTSNNAVAVA